MKLRKNAQIDLITLTSMGVRITPQNRQPVHTSSLFQMQSTSAESNVLNISASLGLSTKVLTKFVKGSPVAQFIQGELRRRNIAFEGPEVEAEGPWGLRHQFNVADSGFGMRGPRVWNDRAGEVGRTLTEKDFDFTRIFSKEGCRILHLSGLIAALSPETSRACVALAKTAKKNGCRISFDLNYRASFWAGREAELRAVFHEIASLSDILVGNEEDFQLALGMEGPLAVGKVASSETDAFQNMIERTSAIYPSVSFFSTTLRHVENANAHLWGAILRAEGAWFTEEPRPIPVLDRIGGGDGFVGGLLYGILKNWPPEKCLQFGWATGALATTVTEDYATPADETQVFSIHQGNARVQR